MNRWIWPGSVFVVVTAATVSATLIGPQNLPPTPFAATETRASIVCPGFASVTSTIRVAAVAAGPSLRIAKIDEPEKAADAGSVHVTENPGGALRVSARVPDPFGGATSVAAETGPDRGLSAVACGSPSTDHWFAGADIRDIAQSEVVVANLDQTTASVDLTVYGAEGRITAPRGIEVEGNSARTISLGALDRNAGPVSVEVSSGDGRVTAFLRQRTWKVDVPLGADWLPEATPPATQLVVPGVPSGAGARTLVVTNPGDLTATVTIGSLTSSGRGQLAGAEQLEVPPQATRSIELAVGLDGQSGAITLDSTQPVAAGLWLDSGGSDARRDPAYTAATRPLPTDSLWPLALGKAAATVLQLANPGEADATVTVSAGSVDDPGQPQDVVVPAGSTVEVPLAAGATNVVRIQTAAPDVRGALVATATLGRVRGLTVVDLSADDPHDGEAPVVFDPHAGS